MKRYIIAAWCIIFSLGLYAQKALIIHKKDGTKIEIPTQGVEGFYFTGKAVVNDGDYTQIVKHKEYIPTTPTGTLALTLYAAYHGGMKFDERGICYSTTPGDVSNKQPFTTEGSLVDINYSYEDDKDCNPDTLLREISGLEFETTYYFRSYVSYQGRYYYSQEYSINTGKPTMGWHGAKVDPAKYTATGYVMPSDSAWETLTATSKYINSYTEFLVEEWNRFLTPERIELLKPQCRQKFDCRDGILYLIDTIDGDFVAHVMDICSKEVVFAGNAAEYKQSSAPVEVTCDAEWGVPNNVYWEYEPSTLTGNPNLTFTSPMPLLANYQYKLEFVAAPETVNEEKLPNKYNLSFKNQESETLGKNITPDPTQCTIYTFEVTTSQFIESSFVLQGKIGARETGFDRTTRVALVKMTPIGPIEE